MRASRLIYALIYAAFGLAVALGPALAQGGGWQVAPVIVLPQPYLAPPAYPAPPAPPPVPAVPAPPGYYAPYPGYQAQQAPLPSDVPQGTLATALSCNAGAYTCPMDENVPVGSSCYCRGNDGAKVYGTAQ